MEIPSYYLCMGIASYYLCMEIASYYLCMGVYVCTGVYVDRLSLFTSGKKCFNFIASVFRFVFIFCACMHAIQQSQQLAAWIGAFRPAQVCRAECNRGILQ